MFALLIAMIVAVPGGMVAILALTSYLEGWVGHANPDALRTRIEEPRRGS